ncbi:fluoride efflux transporter FluC [Halopenitus persicus]|uniref:fluoride efflux transporter FluC n=1 Tax=Halopenitus persicus TaxID=1048396 RepID=UPI000BBB6000|nr:CrcB family protein [Halopenitus persicus]
MRRRQLVRHGKAVVLIAIGGALGATLRHAVGAAAGGALFVTLTVNAVGSFGLGLLLFDARADDVLSKRSRYVLGTGFFASFTTYSTFVADVLQTAPGLAVLYVVASYAAGFGGVIASRTVVSAASGGGIRPPTSGDG